MSMVVTLLFLLSQLPSGRGVDRACVPNTQFLLNGRLCRCNNLGWWTDSDCRSISRRGSCLPGQVTWQGCSQCICQENGQNLCNDASCYDEATYRGVIAPTKSHHGKDSIHAWCTPFKSYYINCSICVCPASGRTSEAHCAADKSCRQSPLSSVDLLLSVNKNICIPKVMYLFPCLHCICSDNGYFILENCVETCRPQQTEPSRRCISRTFYRKNCNVCWCPDDNMPDDKLCTQAQCDKSSKFRSLEALRTTRSKCRPYSFLKPKCIYCGCNTNGNVNENACLELECLKTKEFKYDVEKTTCSPGEMVPSCVECFCMRAGVTNNTYCSTVCSYQSKLKILDKVLRDSSTYQRLIDKKEIKKNSDDEMCEPNSMYIDQGRYCLCPENGSTNFKLCTSATEERAATISPTRSVSSYQLKIDLKANCTPKTLVAIDCNTCYCDKNGKINPKWCTYDDCDAKRIVQDTNKASHVTASTLPSESTTCVPGSISKEDCNYCICPSNGMLKDRACTKNKCTDVQRDAEEDKFVCEPLAYYVVDCNVCLCPQDGVKNVEKCTKKICEKTFLRSDNCVSGQFFCSDCNVCVCPPNGNKADKVCTNHRCSDFDTPWKKIFRLSQNLLENQVSPISKRPLDVCFSGEEFEVDCKICVCPDVGLRSYATCTESMCKDKRDELNTSKDITLGTPDRRVRIDRNKHRLIEDITTTEEHQNLDDIDENVGAEVSHTRYRRDGESCQTFNLSTSSERQSCTPGSMYIIRCRQCICPYLGNINNYCRPMPKNVYCEQAYPNYNYIPMGRRTDEANMTTTVRTLNRTTPGPDSTISSLASSKRTTPGLDSTSSTVTSNQTSPGSQTASPNVISQQTTPWPNLGVRHDHTKYTCITPGRILDECFICECQDDLVLILEHCFKSDQEECEDAKPSFLDEDNKAVIL